MRPPIPEYLSFSYIIVHTEQDNQQPALDKMWCKSKVPKSWYMSTRYRRTLYMDELEMVIQTVVGELTNNLSLHVGPAPVPLPALIVGACDCPIYKYVLLYVFAKFNRLVSRDGRFNKNNKCLMCLRITTMITTRHLHVALGWGKIDLMKLRSLI